MKYGGQLSSPPLHLAYRWLFSQFYCLGWVSKSWTIFYRCGLLLIATKNSLSTHTVEELNEQLVQSFPWSFDSLDRRQLSFLCFCNTSLDQYCLLSQKRHCFKGFFSFSDQLKIGFGGEKIAMIWNIHKSSRGIKEILLRLLHSLSLPLFFFSHAKPTLWRTTVTNISFLFWQIPTCR